MTKSKICLYILVASIIYVLAACNNTNSNSNNSNTTSDSKTDTTQRSVLFGVVAEVKDGKVFVSFEKGALESVIPIDSKAVYEVKGLEGKAKAVHIGEFGGDPNPTLCILLDNGSAYSLSIIEACEKKEFIAEMEVPSGVVAFKKRCTQTEDFTHYENFAVDNKGNEYAMDPLAINGDRYIFLQEEAREVLKLIKAGNYAGLEKYVHPQKGVRFYPYTEEWENGNAETDKQKICLNGKDLVSIAQKGNSYIWGQYAGSGENINLNLKAYFGEFVYDRDYLHGTHMQNGWAFDSPSNREGKRVTFAFDPSSAEALDWTMLELIFEPYNENWYLTAVVHGSWTP